MNNLLLHIEYLLTAHDCVIVPGLGAFLVMHSDAATSEQTGLLTPASRTVAFNASIVNNDGLLVNSIVRRDGVSYQDACLAVEDAVKALRRQIAEEGSVEIGSVGSLGENADGGLVFRPRFTAPGYAAMLGYSPVSFAAPVEEKEEVSEIARKFDTRRNYYIAVNKKFARYAAMIAVIVCAVVSVVIPASNRRQQDMASVIPAELVAKVSEKSEVTEKTEISESSEVLEKADAVQPEGEVAAEAEVAVESEKEFYLIVGAFREATEAQEFISQQAGCGFELKTVATKSMVRIYASASDSREELLSLKRDKKFRELFPEAWVWQKR